MPLKHTCNNPEHKRDAMFTKTVLALLIVTILNTFTSAFIIFTLYASRTSELNDIIRPDLQQAFKKKEKDSTQHPADELDELSMGQMEKFEELFNEFEPLNDVDLVSPLDIEFLNDIETFLDIVRKKLDNTI